MIRDHRNLAAKRTTVKGPAGNSGNGNGNANAKPDPPAQPADSPSAPIPSTASSNPIPPSNSVPSPSSPSSDSNPTPLNSSPSPGSSTYDSSSILLSSGSSPIPSTSHPAPGSSAPSSSAPSSSAIPLPDSCLDCIITTDTNTSLQYNGVWFLNNISGSTTHSTTTPNSSVSFAFHGILRRFCLSFYSRLTNLQAVELQFSELCQRAMQQRNLLLLLTLWTPIHHS